MTTKRQSDFEDRFYDFIQSGMERLERKIDANTDLTKQVKNQAEATNGKVAENIKEIAKLNQEVFGKIKPSDLPSWFRDPKIISTIFNVSLILLALVIAATRVDIGGLLP